MVEDGYSVLGRASDAGFAPIQRTLRVPPQWARVRDRTPQRAAIAAKSADDAVMQVLESVCVCATCDVVATYVLVVGSAVPVPHLHTAFPIFEVALRRVVDSQHESRRVCQSTARGYGES